MIIRFLWVRIYLFFLLNKILSYFIWFYCLTWRVESDMDR
jgi:phage shock protein PspC (stress-responsive transcriptional regulator)